MTATPSTTKPACAAVTTVTGKVTPAGKIRQARLEVQKNGVWEAFYWFESTTDGKHDIVAPVSTSTGAFTLKYLAPMRPSWPATIRLRVRVVNTPAKIDAVSTSWYVTRPSC